jgi:hypothetical protein
VVEGAGRAVDGLRVSWHMRLRPWATPEGGGVTVDEREVSSLIVVGTVVPGRPEPPTGVSSSEEDKPATRRGKKTSCETEFV